MQNEVINKNNILKIGSEILHDQQVYTIIAVWVRHFVQNAFQTFLLAPDTDWSTFTMGRAHYSQLIDSLYHVWMWTTW